MTRYIARRFLYMIVLLVMVSVAAFVIMQLPPGDFVEAPAPGWSSSPACR